MVDEQEILKKLLIDESDVMKDLQKLIEKAKGIFMIETPSARIIFSNLGKLTDAHKICALLSAKYFSKKLNLLKDHSLSVTEIGKEVGRPSTALSGPLKQLIKVGYIQKLPNKKYEISYHRLNEIFDSILGVKNVRDK